MSERTPLIVGNWKMNANHLEAIQMVQKLSYRLELADFDRVEVVVAPPFTSLRSIQILIETDHMRIGLGAQNVHWEDKGAFTGEVSAAMLAKMAVTHVIVGHSERRHLFGETDEVVKKKTRAVLEAGMRPIVCVGETQDQHQAGEAENVVASQVREAVAGLNTESIGNLEIAYEPVWAIGTGRTALPDEAGVIAEVIRRTLTELAASDVAEKVRILYGGSVDPANIKNFMAKAHIDGALVGGASLDPDEFAAIIRYWV